MKKIILCSVLIFCTSGALAAHAAELSLISPDKAVGIGQQFNVTLFVDTQGETINAIEGQLVFPDTLVALERVSDGNSSLNMWIRRPQADSAGHLTFSGITPGGFQTANGKVFSAVFRAKKQGSGALTLHDVKTLLNDGKGTEVVHHTLPFDFSISASIRVVPLMVPKDIDPPEAFSLQIARDPNIFEGKWFLVFATQDKGSGIDRYEVCEGDRTRCVKAESPHVLENQKLDQEIFVNAVDKDGNARVAALPSQHPVSRYDNFLIFGILMGVLIAGIVLRKILCKKFIKSR